MVAPSRLAQLLLDLEKLICEDYLRFLFELVVLLYMNLCITLLSIYVYVCW